MSDDEFGKLKADIKQHGVREPIVTHEGYLVDGKNRLRACKELGVECPTVAWEGGDSLVLWSISRNLHRRHMTPSQRAMIAQKMLPILEQEAAARKKRPKSSPIGEHAERSTKVAAEATGASARQVGRAKRVANADPKKAAEVEAGKKSLRQAEQEITEGPEVQEQPPTDGLGKPVEEKKLWPAFRSDAFDSIVSELNRAKRAVTALCGTPLGKHLHHQGVTSDIDNAIRAVKFAAPYAPCPQCRADGCELCKKLGWVGKARFTAAAEELRA